MKRKYRGRGNDQEQNEQYTCKMQTTHLVFPSGKDFHPVPMCRSCATSAELCECWQRGHSSTLRFPIRLMSARIAAALAQQAHGPVKYGVIVTNRGNLHAAGVHRANSANLPASCTNNYVSSDTPTRSQTTQESQEQPLIKLAQAQGALSDFACLSTVPKDRLYVGTRRAVVHQSGARPESPPRRSTNLIARCRIGGLQKRAF